MELTLPAVLITGITSLAAVVVVLYVDSRGERKRHLEEIKELHLNHTAITEKFVESTVQMKSAVDKNSDAIERNTVVVNDLHKHILNSK